MHIAVEINIFRFKQCCKVIKRKWRKTTVQKILAQQEYCDDVINFKTFSKNFKNKTRLNNPVENWKIFKNVHEPIIDRDTFETVQKMKAKAKTAANGW
ncbi:MAG: recombinase family protein [Clostridia bacterium]|nr:recombinase family protein [Clostridia bacterium]